MLPIWSGWKIRLDLANLLAKPEKGWLHTFTGDVEIPEGVTPIEGVLEKGDTREGWWTTGIDVTVDPDDANDTIPGTPIKVENSTKEVEKDNYITDKDGNQVIDPDNPTVTETVATRVVKGTVTKNGKTLPLRGMKAKTPHDWNPVVGMQFNVQSVSRFYREGILAEDVFSADGSERADYDLDGSVNETTVPPTATNYDDLYVAAETGSFRIRKPMTSVRADTAKLRKLLANNDMGIFVAGDVANKGENDFYITQAINTGGAVNSFIVDWQVPYWATLEGTVLDAPLESPTMAVGRVDSLISSISTGVWEIPGAEYSCAYNYIYEGKNEDVTAELTENGSITRTEKRTEIEFGKPVDKMVAITYTLDSNGNVLDENGKVTSNFKVTRTAQNEAAREEQDFRVFMFVRLAANDRTVAGNGYVEQNGTEYQDEENYALAGTDADRDYFYGEDDYDGIGDSTDYNTADSSSAMWVAIGDKTGYAISDKTNVTLHAADFMRNYPQYQAKQIRWVIKAVPKGATVNNDTLATKKGVPTGFRLAVDAMLDDGNPDHAAYTEGIQEADDLDPLRMNSGWSWNWNFDGTPQLDKNGNVLLNSETFIHEGMTTNAPKICFNTSVKNSPTIGQASRLGEKAFQAALQTGGVVGVPTTVPNVIGQTLDIAKSMLNEVGLAIQEVYNADDKDESRKGTATRMYRMENVNGVDRERAVSPGRRAAFRHHRVCGVCRRSPDEHRVLQRHGHGAPEPFCIGHPALR